MDIVSHAIIGRMVVSKSKNTRKDIAFAMLFAAAPDFFQLPLYLFLGYINHRPYLWPENSDWVGFRAAYPNWILWWDIPHSILFLLAVIIPLTYLLKLNKVVILAYFSHIFVDLFTHTGEWGVKPFFPFDFMVNGFTDAWAWPVPYFFVSWTILMIAVLAIEKVRNR